MSAFLGIFVGVGWPSNGGGGGGPPPAWARVGSIADIDFVNNPPRAWTATGGEVAFADFGTILGDSALFPGNAYDPAAVDSGVGYGDGAVPSFGSFLGDFLDAFANSFTLHADFNDQFQIEFAEGSFDTDITFIYASTQPPNLADNGNNTENTGLFDPGGGNGTPGAHKIAFAVTAASCYLAVDGVSAIEEGVGPATTIDPSTGVPPTDIIFNTKLLKRLTVYNPIKTEAEQRTLTA